MSLIILIWLFCRIEKSIFSQQKHQLSSHFHLQSSTMHCTYERDYSCSAFWAHFNAVKMKQKWAILRMIFALKVLNISSCQDSEDLSLNSITFTNWKFKFSIETYVKITSKQFQLHLSGIQVRIFFKKNSESACLFIKLFFESFDLLNVRNNSIYFSCTSKTIYSFITSFKTILIKLCLNDF